MKSEEPSPENLLKRKNKNLVLEFVDFALCHKKLWLIPLFIIFVLAGLLILVGGSSAAPFLYRLF
jgi:hypothetical protein